VYSYSVHHPYPQSTGEEHRRIPFPYVLDPFLLAFFVTTFDIFLIFILLLHYALPPSSIHNSPRLYAQG